MLFFLFWRALDFTVCFFFFFFNDTATTEIYTLSLHDALPICCSATARARPSRASPSAPRFGTTGGCASRSEEHTSELQSQSNLVCRLLLEKKKRKDYRRAPARAERTAHPASREKRAQRRASCAGAPRAQTRCHV